MLMLNRKVGQKITIGDGITVVVLEIMWPDRVRLGIEAPDGVLIMRAELTEHHNRSDGTTAGNPAT